MPIHMRLTHFLPNPPKPPIVQSPCLFPQIRLFLWRERRHAKRVGVALFFASKVNGKGAVVCDVAHPVPRGEWHAVEETGMGAGE